MPQFTYKALNSDGTTHEETMEAVDRFAVYRKINMDGRKLISLSEKKKRGPILKMNITFLSRVSTQEKITFAQNLSSMIEAGLPITRALSVMEKQSKNEKLRGIITSLNDSISKGKTFSESLEHFPKVFSKLFTSMVKAGEESGNIVGALKMVALQMEKSHAIVKKVRGALIYPAVIVCIMVGITVLMLVYVVPTLSSTFSGMGVELPRSTKMVIGTSNFLRDHYFLAFGGFFAFLFTLWLVIRSAPGQMFLDTFVPKLPVIGLIAKEVNAARTTRTMSSLLSSGVDIVVALEVTKEVLQNSQYKNVLDEAAEVVKKGDPVSSAFIKRSNLYPVFVGEMMAVGEETGKIADMLLGVATFYENEVDQKTKDMSTIIEPILMVIMGVGVGFFAMSMLSPMYSLVDVIK